MFQKRYFIITAIIISASASAQTPLPYYTGFDDSTQTAGWQEFQVGANPGIYGWGYLGTGPIGSPFASLYHPNNTFGPATDTIIDWWVSPQFDFSGGAIIDSMSASIGNSNLQPEDFIGLYLLTGSPDPSLATTETLLVNFTLFPNGPGGGFGDTTDILIPPSTGPSYIAFKFIRTNGLFSVIFDDIYISTFTTGISPLFFGKELGVRLYPNPSTNYLTINLGSNNRKVEVNIVDITGKVIYTTIARETQKIEVNTEDFKEGVYVVQIQTEEFIGTKKFIVKK